MLAEKKHTYTVVLADISLNTFTGNIPKGLPKSVLWTVIKSMNVKVNKWIGKETKQEKSYFPWQLGYNVYD